MQPIPDPREMRDGIWQLGSGTRGCRHCGKVEVHYASNGKAEWRHPGVTCCKGAIQDQLRWRRGDLERLRNQVRQYEQEIMDAEGKLQYLTGYEKTNAETELAKAKAALPLRRQRLRAQAEGNRELGYIGIKPEIAELEEMLAGMP